MGHACETQNFRNLHQTQLVKFGVPERFWKAIEYKLKNQVFDAGDHFRIVSIDYEGARDECDPICGLQAITDISYTEENDVFLIDHCWTFKANEARGTLLQNQNLRTRLAKMFFLETDKPDDELVEEVFNFTWKVSGTFHVASSESTGERLPVWYILDEVGTSVSHSDDPNCRIVPLLYLGEQVMYSLLFPIKDVEAGELMVRDFAEGTKDPIKRKAALISWQPEDFTQYSTEALIQGSDYYMTGHIVESLPKLSNLIRKVTKPKYKVYSQYNLIKQSVTDDRFEMVETEEEADILWYIDHFRDFEKLSETPEKFVNQFPYEYVLTVKDLLCMTCRRGKDKKWFPVTYNINIEQENFLSYFQKREKEGLENYWICKPYNLARGLDILITNNVNCIMRMPDTGPKIVQKYITDPVLYHRSDIHENVKFDIRYVILLKSVKPLNIYVYKHFFLRFANKAFSLDNFDEYEKHFTVMNYQEGVPLTKVLAEEFKEKWHQQHVNIEWNTVEKSILDMIRQIFECATMEEPPCGIGESPQSRSLYAADLMLEWAPEREIQPKILEVNFAPDCKRACEYYPDFFNDIFKLFFLNEVPDTFFTL